MEANRLTDPCSLPRAEASIQAPQLVLQVPQAVVDVRRLLNSGLDFAAKDSAFASLHLSAFCHVFRSSVAD